MTEGPWNWVDVRTGQALSSAQETESGEPVSAEGALNYHAWFRAVSLISQKCAAVARHLYRPSATNPEGKEPAKDHAVYGLVHRRANGEQTAFQFWLQMGCHVASRGNGYAYLWRESSGGPVTELIPVDPDRTIPVREKGRLMYAVYPFGEDGDGRKIDATEMLHFKGFGFDGLTGYPVWEVAAEEIGLAKSERRLEAKRYKNSGRPGMILETPMKLPQKAKDRLRDEWERMYTGLDNAGKTAILDGGLKANKVTMTADEMGQTAAAQMSLVAISNFTGVPVSKLGGQKPFASQEMEDRAFVNDGLDFWLNVLDDEATAKLLTEAEQKSGYEVKSKRESLLRPDTKTKFDVLRTATAGRAFMTPNEAREAIDMPPSDDDDADKLLTPLNMGQGGAANQPENPADAQPGRPADDAADAVDTVPFRADDAPAPADDAAEEDAAARGPMNAARFAFAHAATRMLKRVSVQAVSAAERGSTAYVAFCTKFVAAFAAPARSEFAPAERIASALAKSGALATGEIADWFVATLANEYNAVADTATEKTVAARVRSLYARLMLTLPQAAADVGTAIMEPPKKGE